MDKYKIIHCSLFLFSILFSCKLSQKTTSMPHTECDSLFFDLDTGMINAVSPRLSQADIKEWFTCYTGSTPDGASENCGGGVFYKRHGFSYYTYFNYVEVSKEFKGRLSSPLLGAARNAVRQWYPETETTSYQQKEYSDFDFIPKAFGCLRIEYANDTVVRVSAHFTLCESVDVCPTHQ
jgi:hypothetical protein